MSFYMGWVLTPITQETIISTQHCPRVNFHYLFMSPGGAIEPKWKFSKQNCMKTQIYTPIWAFENQFSAHKKIRSETHKMAALENPSLKTAKLALRGVRGAVFRKLEVSTLSNEIV